jgi:hypothetical protein
MDTVFWSRVDVLGPDECWNWKRTPSQRYGKYNVRVSGKWALVSAHRYAYQQEHGAIPDGTFVCHSCDNPRCCNPAHLWVGTNSDNQWDSVVKGRHKNNLPPSRIGTGHHSNKLAPCEVLAIRARHASGEAQCALAREYGVVQNAIYKIVHGESWKHL